MIRIVANMCLHAAVGTRLTCSPSDINGDMCSFEHLLSKVFQVGHESHFLVTKSKAESLAIAKM